MYLVINLAPVAIFTSLLGIGATLFANLGQIVVTVGGLIIAPAVLKASSNAVKLVKDGKIGLEAQGIIKRISEYDEQIGTIIIDKNIKFDNKLFASEITKIKENMKKIKEKEKALEQIKQK